MSQNRLEKATRGPTRVIIGAGVALALFYFVLGYRAHLRNQRILDRIEALRADVREARVAADSCTNELAMAESLFRQTQSEADSLRSAVESREAPLPGGGRGVDAQEYDAYMEAFDDYNEAVGRWESQAEAVRARDQSCRELAEVHNALVDSLQALLAEHGLTG